MLIPLDELVKEFDLKITGVLHLGAHLGEEAVAYSSLGITNVWWVEANPDLIPQLEQNVLPYGYRVIQALVAPNDGGLAKFYVTNNGQSSSMLELKLHKKMHPEVHVVEIKMLSTMSLDTLWDVHGVQANFLNMDLQGGEGLALSGGSEALANIDYIYTEVNEKELYKGCPLVADLEVYLQNYRRVKTSMTQFAWGDALLIRKGLLDAV